MLKEGDMVMVLSKYYSPHYNRITTVKRFSHDGVMAWTDDFPTWGLWKLTELAQLPYPRTNPHD